MRSQEIILHLADRDDWLDRNEMAEELGISKEEASAWLGRYWRQGRVRRRKNPKGRGYEYMISKHGWRFFKGLVEMGVLS